MVHQLNAESQKNANLSTKTFSRHLFLILPFSPTFHISNTALFSMKIVRHNSRKLGRPEEKLSKLQNLLLSRAFIFLVFFFKALLQDRFWNLFDIFRFFSNILTLQKLENLLQICLINEPKVLTEGHVLEHCGRFFL